MIQWVCGVAGSVVIAGLAFWKRSLSVSGFWAAVVVGTLLYAMGSLAWFGTLIAFFVSSSLLSKFKQRAKAQVEEGYEKSGRRDAGQVLANGGLGVVLCLLHQWHPHLAWWWAFVGVMATVNSDTWATEIGGLSRTAPRSILTGRKVPAGTSGGVSRLGLLATAAGGLFIGGIAWAFSGGAYPAHVVLLAGLLGGVVGSLTDSLLGATWQVMHRCTVCGREMERREHCGQPTKVVRGVRWLNNDGVNLMSSVAGGVAAWLVGFWLTSRIM